MTHKYERKCWSCGGKDMEDKGDYVQCRSCGTTWNYTPHLGALPITEVDAKTGRSPVLGRPTEYKPRGAKI